MKRMNVLMAVALMLAAFTACEAPVSQAKQDAINLNNYVDSVKNLTPVYTSAYWTEVDNGYRKRALKAEASLAKLEAADKAEVEASISEYATIKADYEVKIKDADANIKLTSPDHRMTLRNSLFGEGVVGSDMNFGFATASNLLSIYRNFVNTVDANKKNYTREDWDEIKVLYEALDSRKNTVEKELPKGDNRKIGGLKFRFGVIKATNRGGAKAEENRAAKENN